MHTWPPLQAHAAQWREPPHPAFARAEGLATWEVLLPDAEHALSSLPACESSAHRRCEAQVGTPPGLGALPPPLLLRCLGAAPGQRRNQSSCWGSQRPVRFRFPRGFEGPRVVAELQERRSSIWCQMRAGCLCPATSALPPAQALPAPEGRGGAGARPPGLAELLGELFVDEGLQAVVGLGDLRWGVALPRRLTSGLAVGRLASPRRPGGSCSHTRGQD